METFSGYVEKIVYRNEDNGYTVLSVSFDNEEIVCVGTFQFINEGEYVSFTGKTTAHPSYGEQFSVQSYEIKEPEDEKAVLKMKIVWRDDEGRKKHQERMSNGFRLFGKYYEALWD